MGNTFSVLPAHLLPDTTDTHRWLIEELWTDQAVGIIGGEPKCCKSFLALTLAVAVAGGVPCFGRFKVTRPGPVLLFAAEDNLSVVKERLLGITSASGLHLSDLPLHVIIEPHVRLDRDDDYRKLHDTVEHLKPRLVILDPFVRLHAIDENSSSEVAPLLAKLRVLQRSMGCAVMVVHHAKKGGGALRQGQALRGSSEFHAWGDANLYVRRGGDGDLLLTVEHRAAPSLERIPLRLNTTGRAPFLELTDGPQSVENGVLRVLGDSETPLRFEELRKVLTVKASRLSDALKLLRERNQILHSKLGYQTITPRK
jgi:AAA domain